MAIKPLDEVQIETRVGPKEVEKAPEPVELVDEDLASQKETFAARLDKLARKEIDDPLPDEKIAFITADEAATKAISKKERLVASRKSILNCKRDLTDMVELFQKHTQELEKEKRRQQAEQADNTMRQLRNARYDKDHDTQKYWKEKTGSETVFDIDTTGSFVAGGGLGGLLGDTPAKPKAAAPLQPNKQLSPAPLPKRQKQHSAESTPIIMIPNAMRGSLLSMLNCKDFLVSYRFVPDVAGEKPALVKLQRVNKSGLPQTFRVFDSPLRLKDSDWPHVVAVIALGQKWQFKAKISLNDTSVIDFTIYQIDDSLEPLLTSEYSGWPNGWNDPVTLFSKAAGFYFYQEDTEIPEAIKSWNVHKILISKNKRHLDHTAATEFWTQLERSMELRGLQT